MEAGDLDQTIEAFINEHFMSSWLTESSLTTPSADDFFDSPLLTKVSISDNLHLNPKIPQGMKDRNKTKLPKRSQHQDHAPPLPSPTLPYSATLTSIESTTSSSSPILSSLRSVHSLHKLKMSTPAPNMAPRPYSASFFYDPDPDSSSSCWSIHQTTTPATTTNNKLAHVIRELIETERVYYHDMLLIEEIYMPLSNGSPWAQNEIKSLFGTLSNVLNLEKVFLPSLEASEDNVAEIGKTFLTMIDRMEQVYSAYCKRHQDVIKTLNQQQRTRPDVANFLKRCSKAMEGRTTSWDLDSLLIKPVQRILKYPLLLQEMASLMSPPDPDLSAALAGIQRVADCINETMRRKDMVDLIVGGKIEQSSVVHGINKSLARKAYLLKKATGLAKKPTATLDAEFDTLNQQFENQQHLAHHLVKDSLEWVQAIKHLCHQAHSFAVSAESFYDSPHGPVREFSQVSFDCIAGELEHQVQKWIDTRIRQYLNLFDKPSLLIAKRARKRVDYERKTMADEENEEFMVIHVQLIEELPRFIELAAQFFDIVLFDFSTLQAETYQRFWQEWLRLGRMLPTDDDNERNKDRISSNSSSSGIIGRYRKRMKPLLECLDNIGAAKPAPVDGDLLTWDDFLRAGSKSCPQDI